MTVYVIGNGFDLHYGLKTSYTSFKKYLTKVNRDVVERMDDLFDRYNMANQSKDIEEWNTLEDMLVVFCELDGDEIYEEALSNAETDDDRADFFDSPSWNVGVYTRYIDILKQEFTNWLNEMNIVIKPDSFFMPSKEDFILTFNYTETVEKNYVCSNSNILHIHGKVGDNLVLGHNDYRKPYLYNIEWSEDSDYRSTKAMEDVNRVLLSAAKLYYKDSESILEYHSSFFDHVKKCDKVVFLGLSCGEQDNIYVEEIVDCAENIDFFWHDKHARERFQSICDRVNPGAIINYFMW
ncbi:MAG: AbiH family protein [Lachnospiraceae bacterium]|nr:AbiH family protein [Lachnospiraceae bacterium]